MIAPSYRHLCPSQFHGTPDCNERAALHSHGTDAHCRREFCKTLTGNALFSYLDRGAEPGGITEEEMYHGVDDAAAFYADDQQALLATEAEAEVAFLRPPLRTISPGNRVALMRAHANADAQPASCCLSAIVDTVMPASQLGDAHRVRLVGPWQDGEGARLVEEGAGWETHSFVTLVCHLKFLAIADL